MGIRHISDLTAGAQLARSVYDEQGRVLLAADTVLTPAYIGALRARGFRHIAVRDGLADDVVPSDFVSERVRIAMTGHVSKTFDAVCTAAALAPRVESCEDAVSALESGSMALPDMGAHVEAMYDDIESLIGEVVGEPTLASLASLKSHNNYTFQHSVDVALIGALLGRKLELFRIELQELVLGCLLHDIGKVFIENSILNKPGKLTLREFQSMRQHPRMGYEIVRRMPLRSILPAHVAYQHHERQGGGGYPQGLRGANTTARKPEDRANPRRMLLIAEIAAVADVYSAISSDRSYRDAMPPDVAADVIEQMAGSHLNREVVRVLRTIVPRYPAGHWVEVREGRHAGWRGVVTKVHLADLDRPTVRLVHDAGGEVMADPPHVDLRDDPDTRIACAPAQPQADTKGAWSA